MTTLKTILLNSASCMEALQHKDFLQALESERLAARKPKANKLDHKSLLKAIIEKRNTIPVLGYVNVRKEGLTATDMDIELSIAQEQKTYGYCAPLDAIGLEGMTYSEGKLTGNGKSFAALPQDNFPTMSTITPLASFTMQTKDLKRAIEKTLFAVNKDESRWCLCGIFLHSLNGILTFTANDGHRLAKHTTTTHCECPDSIVPFKTCNVLLKACDYGDLAYITVADCQISIVIGNIIVKSKLIDGQYPDYNRVIPSDGTTPLFTLKTTDATAIKALPASKRGGLEFSQDGIFAKDDETSATMPLNWHSGEIALNQRYVVELLKACDAGKKTFMGSDDSSPCIVQDGETLFLIMPMRV